ncbi:MAG: glycosyltransferase [Acidimicrobiales bacterium]|jgi:cellulose synthase/poly-beta-1,6-N-acetylglucosamine synthase-like glycosyltransferase
MVRRSRLKVGALIAAASTGHVLYPAWLAMASRRREAAPVSDPESWPAVTVLVAAYGEAQCIGPKVRDALANGYPGQLDVMVVADADIETAVQAEHAGATVVTADDRLGKAQAINLGFSKVTAPVVVITDANNTLSRGAIAAMVRHFGDPAVGAVAGEKVEADGAGEDLYWRFESWLKQREWRLGTTIGLVGELAAIRTDAWRPIPPDIAIDDLWIALDLSGRGYAIAYEPSAKAVEPPVHTLGQQWERRTRSVANALHVFQRRRSELGPSGGLVAAEIWGHRLARYTVSPLAHVALLWIAVRRVRSSRLAKLFLLGHGIGIWTVARRATSETEHLDEPAGDAVPGTSGADLARCGANALGQGVFLQAVALGGIVRYLRGDRPTQWTTVRR